jgi:hypothetical protein
MHARNAILTSDQVPARSKRPRWTILERVVGPHTTAGRERRGAAFSSLLLCVALLPVAEREFEDLDAEVFREQVVKDLRGYGRRDESLPGRLRRLLSPFIRPEAGDKLTVIVSISEKE